jgi:DNA-binding HxlR family transcriptional regulator
MANNDNFIEIQPVSDALEIIGGKWKFPIIFSLCHSKKRYKELERDLNGVSPKALTNALKDLEING